MKDTQSVNIQLAAVKATRKGRTSLSHKGCDAVQLAKHFIFFNARILTPVLAGLALTQVSYLVKGLMPRRALIAGLRTVVTFISPGRVN